MVSQHQGEGLVSGETGQISNKINNLTGDSTQETVIRMSDRKQNYTAEIQPTPTKIRKDDWGWSSSYHRPSSSVVHPWHGIMKELQIGSNSIWRRSTVGAGQNAPITLILCCVMIRCDTSPLKIFQLPSLHFRLKTLDSRVSVFTVWKVWWSVSRLERFLKSLSTGGHCSVLIIDSQINGFLILWCWENLYQQNVEVSHPTYEYEPGRER